MSLPAAALPPASDGPRIPGYRIEGVMHRSRWRVVLAAQRLSDGAQVVLKTVDAEYPTRQQLAELRREHAILQRLQPVEGVIRVLGLEPHGQGNQALVTERFGRSLAQRLADRAAQAGRSGLAPLPLAQVLDVAIAVTRTLSQLHELDLVHKGIEPHNILLDDAGAIRLIDFGIASELSQERAEGLAPNRLEGSLPFMSPEQTGRMNRALDYRTDFYALGVTLFQLLTSRLPFQAETPLEWVHCHLSRVPPSASEFVPALPATVAAIVARLLAKNADERYQSGFGLIEDLSRCKRELAQTGTVTGFCPGSAGCVAPPANQPKPGGPRDGARQPAGPAATGGRRCDGVEHRGWRFRRGQVGPGERARTTLGGPSGLDGTWQVRSVPARPALRRPGHGAARADATTLGRARRAP